MNLLETQTKARNYAEGGMTEGAPQVDPVSGNEVPPGALPEEVRDDVDAKLSGGEYVIPADVLRYYGVNFFEKLRKKAKEGLQEMDSEGRIGGSEEEEAPALEEEDDFPFSEEDLMFEEEAPVQEFAEGGVVEFDPNSWSTFGQPLAQPPAVKTESRTYENAQGQKIVIQFLNGQPQQPIPAGFFPLGSVPKPSTSNSSGSNTPEAFSNPTPSNLAWAEGKDWTKLSPSEALTLANERLEGNKVLSAGAKLVGAINPLAGLAAGVGVKLRPYAEVNGIERILRESGNDKAADAVANMLDKKLAEGNVGIRTLEPLLASGKGVAEALRAQSSSGSGSGSSTSLTPNVAPSPRPQATQQPVVSRPQPRPTPAPTPVRSGGQAASDRSGGRYAKGGIVTRPKKKDC